MDQGSHFDFAKQLYHAVTIQIVQDHLAVKIMFTLNLGILIAT